MSSSKAPGIDGFNAHFFKRSWHIIGKEVVAAVQQFFVDGYLPTELNVALVTLLPKCDNADRIKNFRPISCCSVLYKIISKILANRLKEVLGSIIGKAQSAFVPGRLIFDNILLSHELIKGYQRKNISPRCMIKIDVQKAYDSVEWPFLNQVLEELGFPYQFSHWIMSCLTSVTYVLTVNGEVLEPFVARKGIRQGDPISPYLFVICMEYLSRSLGELKQNAGFRYHPRCKKLGITHACFADDLLLFSRGDLASVQMMMQVLDHFGEVSGLKANQMKSCLYFGGVEDAEKRNILAATGMMEGSLPFRYLGVPLSAQKLSVRQCQPLVQKILHRMSTWAAKLLSYAGRVQLIKSVVAGIHIYWCQVFVLPQKVIKFIQQACRIFLWTGRASASRRALVAWEKVVLPKQAGGMNIGNMKLWNQATICKLLWRIQQKKDAVWIQWVHIYYIKGRDLLEMPIPQQGSWVVRKILGARECVRRLPNRDEVMQHRSFSVKRVYMGLLGEVERVPWAKVVCQNPAPAKCKFIVWLLLHAKLVTCDRLRRFGIMVDSTCCLCDTGDETLDHIFFECQFARRVWDNVATWCGVEKEAVRWEQSRRILLAHCTNNNITQRNYRCMVTILVYHLWRERNARRMQRKKERVEEISGACRVMYEICRQSDRKLRGRG